MQFDFLTPERQLSLDEAPVPAPLNPEHDTTDLITETPEFKAELAKARRARRRDKRACDQCGDHPDALYCSKGVKLCGRCAYPEAYK